jgi:hypothetical protein
MEENARALMAARAARMAESRAGQVDNQDSARAVAVEQATEHREECTRYPKTHQNIGAYTSRSATYSISFLPPKERYL